MTTRHKVKHFTWVDLASPSPQSVVPIAKEFQLDDSVKRELASPGSQARVDLFDQYVYLRLCFPIFTSLKDGEEDHSKEINFVISKDYLITAHYEQVRPIYKVGKLFDNKALAKEKILSKKPIELFFVIMEKLYEPLIGELESIDAMMQRIEGNVFKGREKEMVEELSRVNRDLIDFRRDMRTHGAVLSQFRDAFIRRFGYGYTFDIESLRSKHEQLMNMLDGNRELLNDLKSTNDALLANKTNEVMKVLTVMGFVMFPLTLIAGIFGMNSTLPFVGGTHDFLRIMGIMAISFFLTWGYLRNKGWL